MGRNMMMSAQSMNVGKFLENEVIPEIVWIPPECDFKLLEKLIHPCKQGLRCTSQRLHTWSALKDNHSISQVGGHNKIVLYNKSSSLGMKNEPFDNLRERFWLVKGPAQ